MARLMINGQKADIVYGSEYDYITDEKVIGTWLGKNLYQRVIRGLSWSLTGTANWQNITITSIPNPHIETCISVRLYRTYADGKNMEEYRPIHVDAQDYNNGLYIELRGHGNTILDAVLIDTIILQYTKSTD